MEAITSLFEGMDLAKLTPDLEKLLERIPQVTKWAVMAGPLILLVLGLVYLFLPPKEANHRFGFRTWFGMGSVEAWRFTQRLAGLVLGALGLVLTVVMGILAMQLGKLEPVEMVSKAITYLLWQAGLILFSYIAICLVVLCTYDRKGRRRR